MKLTFNLDGRAKNLSPEELDAIIGKYFAAEAKAYPPQIGQWFKVTPLEINQEIFKEKIKYKKQEKVRLIILEAFEELKKYPDKYGRTFETMIPEKTWSSKTGEELKTIASSFGDGMANWVEQALEWAQRIANGEKWNTVCNRPDISKWYRLVIWSDGKMRMIGGSRADQNKVAAADVVSYEFVSSDLFKFTVPLIVRYK